VDPALVEWLVTGALGPALAALPVNWSAAKLGRLARRWLDRLRHVDGLSRLLAAAGVPGEFTNREFSALRKLLEEPRTWLLIGDGSVEDLAAAIGACWPDAAGSGPDRQLAGRVIAKGLLEFAVSELEPELFQRVLMARISRLEARQAEKIDDVALRLQASLAAWSAYRESTDEHVTRRVLGQLGQVLDRLPPGPADRDEICVYLAALICWLNADPWPQDPRLAGPALTPADIEQNLSLRDGRGQERDAAEMAGQCTRLVVLGSPGSGKTWLAKRIARSCAEAALETLARGDTGVDDVELPLFTTCSLLSRAPGGIRRAVVSSALDQLGDLGGSRITDALNRFFTERNAATLLVIDSLDEARAPDERLRQLAMSPWRIVMTSRPGSWAQQLPLDPASPSHQVADVQPLRYPGDVEAFITKWFTADPARGQALTGQILSRPDLQQVVTVPLILTFCCIIGAEQELPVTRHEVYSRVLWQVLSGLWRGSDGLGVNPPACAAILREWAWQGATSDEITGIGTWADEVVTPRLRLPRPDRAALDHVAVPVGRPDLATGALLRRFIHRSLREHLTAEYVARMSPGDAAAELLNHLWYDSDWEYAGPAALVMHPQRDDVLRQLICRISGSGSSADDLTVIDGCWELRLFLARVAADSHESHWTPESAAIIGQARLDIADKGPSRLMAAPGWPATNSQIRHELLAELERSTDSQRIHGLSGALRWWGATPDELASACRHVLNQMEPAYASDVCVLAETLARLDAKPADLSRARQLVLDYLDVAEPMEGSWLAGALTELEAGPADLARARNRVLDLLESAGPWTAGPVAELLPELGAGPADLARARNRVLDLLESADLWNAGDIVKALGELDAEPSELARARRRALDLMDRSGPDEHGSVRHLADVLGTLRPGPVDVTRACHRMLDLIDARAVEGQWRGTALVDALAGAGAGEGEFACARKRILDVLDQTGAADPRTAQYLTEILSSLSPSPGDLSRARNRMLELLDAAAPGDAAWLASLLSRLAPQSADRVRAGARVLGLLAIAGPEDADGLAWELGKLDAAPADLAGARKRVKDLLVASAPSVAWGRLARALKCLHPDQAELRDARCFILNALGQIDASEEFWSVWNLKELLACLDATPTDLGRIRGRIIGMLSAADPKQAQDLSRQLRQLEATPVDLAHARRRIAELLTTADTDPMDALHLTTAFSSLEPVSSDLRSWTSWKAPPVRRTLKSARHNSPVRSWIEALPALAALPAEVSLNPLLDMEPWF
jgi:NACHT domain-containing protein